MKQKSLMKQKVYYLWLQKYILASQKFPTCLKNARLISFK